MCLKGGTVRIPNAWSPDTVFVGFLFVCFKAFLKKYLKSEFHAHLDRVQVKGNVISMHV